MEKLIEELKNGTGDFLKTLGSIANNFGYKPKEVIKALKDACLEPEFLKIIATTCCYMAYQWEWENKNCEGEHWDERNRAAKGFCYNNYDFFRWLYEDLMATPFPIINPEYKSFFDDLTDKRWLFKEEIYDFRNEHHTIQQRIIATFYDFLTEVFPEHDFFPAPGYRSIHFPFI